MEPGKGQQEKVRDKKSLKISLRITALVLTIFIIASFVCLFSFDKSLGTLAKNSKDKVVESVAALVSSSHTLVARNFFYVLYVQRISTAMPSYDEVGREFRSALKEGRETALKKPVDGLLKAMIESGILGFKAGYFAVPPTPGINDKAVIVSSSDLKYLSENVPDEVAAIIESGRNYRLFEDGIPEMGLKGEYLVTSYKLADKGSTDAALWYFDFKPMGKLLSGIDAFYQKESRNAVLTLCLAMGISILGLLFISFLVLGYLIKMRISRPIEELSSAAERIIEGDMDVRLRIKPREEFSELKRAFNKMITSISGIILKALDQLPEDRPGERPEKEETVAKTYLKPRSTILFQVIALFTVVFIAAGAFFMLSIGKSMDSLVKKSKDTLIDTEAQLILSSHEFGSRLAALLNAEGFDPVQPSSDIIEEFADALSEKMTSRLQDYLNESLGYMVKYGLFDYSLIYCVLPPGTLIDDYTVVVSSDEKYMYTKPPEEVLKFFDMGPDEYIFYKNGIPAMGWSEPYLATSYQPGSYLLAATGVLLIDFKPMGKEVKAIDRFYANEKSKLLLTMGIIIGASILILIFITAFALSYLIRKQITWPIDELVAVVDEVMDGNFDIQAQIRPGEELANLKRAFNEMIKALRDLVDKSAGG